MNPKINNLLTSLLIILAVIVLGLFAINQFFGFIYKIHFLKSPCDLCGKMNPDVSECIERLNYPRLIYPMKDGKWTDPLTNKTYMNLSLKL